jgi:hypothetical protein
LASVVSIGAAALSGIALVTIAAVAGHMLPWPASAGAAGDDEACAPPLVTREAFDAWACALAARRAAEVQ